MSDTNNSFEVPEESGHGLAPTGTPLIEEAKKDVESLSKEFRTGLITSLILNGVLVCIYWFSIGLANLEQRWDWQPVWQFGAIWFIVNLGIIILLAFVKREISQGLVAGLAWAFFTTFVVGAFLTLVCYSALGY